jgi:gas vesicle protein
MNDDRVYYSHEAEVRARREMTTLVVFYLMLGLGIGAGLALLFAPSPAKKVREDLSRAMEEGWNTGREAMEPMIKRVGKEFGEFQKNVEEHLKQN